MPSESHTRRLEMLIDRGLALRDGHIEDAALRGLEFNVTALTASTRVTLSRFPKTGEELFSNVASTTKYPS